MITSVLHHDSKCDGNCEIAMFIETVHPLYKYILVVVTGCGVGVGWGGGGGGGL